MNRIVVGIDGSPAATTALRWAVREAALRDARVEAWHAWQVPDSRGDGAPPDERAYETAARETLANAVRDATVFPDPQPEPVLLRAIAASALLDAARGAELVVLGAATGSRPGSVLGYVTAHAGCPVVVVPADWTD